MNIRNPSVDNEIKSELELVIVCQKIRDEIARLERDRTDYNLFIYSTEAKINILNRLLQLLLSPDSFSDEYKEKFRDRTDFSTLVASVLKDTQFKNKYTDKLVPNNDVFLSPDTIFSGKKEKITFIDDLLAKHGEMKLRKQTPIEELDEDEGKIEINELVILGDSLTDLNLMRNSAVGGFSGLKGNSPLGSFTNGMTWIGNINYDIFNKATMQAIKTYLAKEYPDSDFSQDDIKKIYAMNEKSITDQIPSLLTDNDNRNIFYINKKVVSRSYAIGGATAYDYKGAPSKDLKRFFTRLIVTTLAKQRKLFLEDEAQANVQPEDKKKKLIIEWIGANDLITVNELPSMLEADNLIEARIQNIKKLIKNGYINFVLGNLPDLSLTPRYQAKSQDEQTNARLCTEYVNRKLDMCVDELKRMYPACNIQVIDVNTKYKACIEGIRAGGDQAKPYMKYINKEYNLIKCDVLPRRATTKNDFHVKFNDKNGLSYVVLDACATSQQGDITLKELSTELFKGMDTNSDTYETDKEKKIKDIGDEITEFKTNGKLSNPSELRKCILAITTQRGDTLDEKNPFIALKDTKAFERFQEKLARETPPRTIEDIHYLFGDNVLFFDDVHPSKDIHKYISDEIMQSIGKQFKISIPVFPLKLDDVEINAKKLLSKHADKPDVSWTDTQMVTFFLRHYFDRFNKARKGLFGFFCQSNLQWQNPDKISLAEILKHGIKEKGYRTLDLLINLGWITPDGKIAKSWEKNVALQKALQQINPNQTLANRN